tara:strand:+ start:3702 stop:4121 length:420 start_codon:yes stop_codon:yes gene_type:complete
MNVRYCAAYVLARPNEIRWLKPFLNKEIGHLTLAFKDLNNKIVIVDPTIYGCIPGAITAVKSEEELVEWVHEFGFKILKLPRYTQRKISVGYPSITSCVSFIKYAIGYQNLSITPYQLWRRFMRDGAQVLNPPQQPKGE